MFGYFLGAVSRPPLAVVGTSKKGKVPGAKKRHSIKRAHDVVKENKIEAGNSLRRKANASTEEKRNLVQLNKFKTNNGRKVNSGNVEQPTPRARKGGEMRTRQRCLLKLNKQNINQTKDKTMIDKATKRAKQRLKYRHRIKFIQSYRDKHIEFHKQARTIFHKQRLKDKEA